MNQEFESWSNYFKTETFKKRLDFLSKKCQNKKVIFYCNGIFFEAFQHVYNLKDFFNIIGFSDIKYETDENSDNLNLAPSRLKNIDFDYLIVTSPNPNLIKKYLIENKVVYKSKILSLIDTKPKKDFVTIKNFYKESKNLLKTLKYACFCSSEELEVKTNYAKVLKKIKHKQKIKIAIVCEENSKWGYQFVYEELKKDSRFKILPIILYPIITKNRIEYTQEENKKFFDKLGIDSIDGYDYENKRNRDLKDFEPDIVFYQQPWYLQGNNHPIAVSEFALTIMIPYGFTTLSEKEWGSDSVKKVYSNLWKFFSESKYHNKFYEKAAKMKGKDILLATGTPKLDYYFEPTQNVVWKGKNIKSKIIWAPHHSLGKEGLRMSTFKDKYEYFLNLAKTHPDYSFIVKPHPALKNACTTSGFMSEKVYNEYINEWNSLPNAYVYDKGGYFDIFKTSDLLITDCSSFLAEYFPTENPIIFLNRPDRAKFDSFGEKLRKGFYECNSIQELDTTLNKLLETKQDYLKFNRLKLKKRLFNQTMATKNLITLLKKEFSKD